MWQAYPPFAIRLVDAFSRHRGLTVKSTSPPCIDYLQILHLLMLCSKPFEFSMSSHGIYFGTNLRPRGVPLQFAGITLRRAIGGSSLELFSCSHQPRQVGLLKIA